MLQLRDDDDDEREVVTILFLYCKNGGAIVFVVSLNVFRHVSVMFGCLLPADHVTASCFKTDSKPKTSTCGPTSKRANVSE